MPKPRILIIEDEKQIVEALKLRLEANGYDILTAADGADGLLLARQKKPDLIILDVLLPKMNGYKVCRMLKFDENYKSIPIIMLTAKVLPGDIEQGLQSGANAYLTKPFKAEELLEKIKSLLKPLG